MSNKQNLTPPETEAAQAVATLDPRLNAFRSDLAAQYLYGKVNAPRYTQGVEKQVARPAVPVRRRPQASAGFETEALLGEIVTVYDEADGWAWVQLARDRYVGYVPASALTAEINRPTHRVRALGTFVYPTADIKASPLVHLSLNALVTVIGGDERFSQLATGGYVATRHLAEPGRFDRDFVSVAERFIDTPYLWGGRTRIGIDCSGLVQVALEAAGFSCPRDSDMQQTELGTSVLVPDTLEGLQRGDIVFWKGHVGIMSDGVMMVHANAHHMAVVAETLPEATERIAKVAGPLTAIKRLPGLSA